MSEEVVALTDLHKAVVQYMMSVRFISTEIFIEQVFKRLYLLDQPDANTDMVDYQEEAEKCITAINENIHELNFEIRKFKNQHTNRNYYLFVNTLSDKISRLLTKYGPNEIKYINDIIDMIMEDEDETYAIRAPTAQNIIYQSPSSSKTMKEVKSFLGELVDNGWFEHNTTTDTYSLSVRSLVELKPNLLERYGEKNAENINGLVSLCKRCSNIAISGIKCKNNSCFIRFHSTCGKEYFQSQNSTTCPNENCMSNWPNRDDWNENNLIRFGIEPS
ncbi:hypothetical protein PACTADRAFT_31021 [Pachysolen tannophilus NRRL Y-2460]|uniref:Non-structural maintenance of chromosomes element 1 homolog n=1 Tax=Pachysolen tannophilus NRRL Y-2460 TaxID=669874 RepID=A0A1E4U0Q5_PACTA|nr:hypothetical protein PACTADRAFT_31021 [Pachysolen tannophilus NRRL Y-2460]